MSLVFNPDFTAPIWILREIENSRPRNIILDKNSGLVCCDIDSENPTKIPEKSKLRAIGLWSNNEWNYVRMIKQMSEITTRLGIEIYDNTQCENPKPDVKSNDEYSYEHADRRDPIEITWNPDFTFICPDRDILISRKCLMKHSKLFSSILEDDKECKSLEISWRSKGIIFVMDVIHVSRCADLCRMTVPNNKYGQDSIEFCFQYGIDHVLPFVRKAFIAHIPGYENSSSWLSFFHKFKNPDGSEVFAKEIDEIRKSVVNLNRIDKYLELTSNQVNKDSKNDDREIMRMMNEKLTNLSDRYGL